MGQLRYLPSGSNWTVDQHIAGTHYAGDDWAVAAIQNVGGAWSEFVGWENIRWDAAFGDMIADSYLYFDGNCNRIPLAQVPANGCDAGHVLWRGSPVSLNFAPYKSIAQGVTFTQFPLVPGASERWFAWKASADHPLLVIDPTHQGEITSPYQLFGNWSFGGQNHSLTTMLTPSSLPAREAKPWNHGFEALATLDGDKDGAIRGSELTPLALWFDNNRNGISERGEVRLLGDVGITSLFYKEAEYDHELDGLHLALGFERIVSEKRVSGSSFDWFSAGDPSKERLIISELRKGFQSGQAGEVKSSGKSLLPRSEVDSSSAINGSWEWVSDLGQNPSEPSIGGILNFLAFKNGEIRGTTISESHYSQPYPVNSVVSLTRFEGSITGEGRIDFTVRSAQWKLESTATLSGDGKTLAGNTTATQADNKKSFVYTWTAKKKG